MRAAPLFANRRWHEPAVYLHSRRSGEGAGPTPPWIPAFADMTDWMAIERDRRISVSSALLDR